LTQRGEGEDRYEDFYNQPLDQELADSVGWSLTVPQILAEIGNEFNKTNMAKALFPNLNFKFAINDLLK
jgi:uncharacterized membrane protein